MPELTRFRIMTNQNSKLRLPMALDQGKMDPTPPHSCFNGRGSAEETPERDEIHEVAFVDDLVLGNLHQTVRPSDRREHCG